jgi:hypothetical protein
MNLCIAAKASSMKALVNVALPSTSGDDFEAFLPRTAEEILDHAVRDVISEVDRIIFEEEASDVTV